MARRLISTANHPQSDQDDVSETGCGHYTFRIPCSWEQLHDKSPAQGLVGAATGKKNYELIKCRHSLTTAERHAYIDAELCLMSSPPKSGLEGAKNRWDELHWVHVVQSNVIHGVVSKIDKWRV